MNNDQGESLPENLHEIVVRASVKLLSIVSTTLHNHSQYPLINCKFNIGDLAHVFQVGRQTMANSCDRRVSYFQLLMKISVFNLNGL